MSICCTLASVMDSCKVPSSSHLVWQIFAKRVHFKASLNIFSNRIRWRWFFRDTPIQQFSICVQSHGKTKVCTHPVAPSLDLWISNFKRCFTEVFVKSSRTASRDRSFCSKIPPVNFGLEVLSKSGLEAVANDKDGVYSLVDPEVLTDIHLQLLGNGQYFETELTNWTDGVRKLRCHTLLCVNVLKISSKNLNLRENCRNPCQFLEQRLKYNS